MKNPTIIRRAKRTRAKVRATVAHPRLSVFRSGKYIYAQIIDDRVGRTLAAARDLAGAPLGEAKRPQDVGFAKVAQAYRAGEHLAKIALAAGVSKVAFDRGSYAYKGRVRAFAEGARAGGLKF